MIQGIKELGYSTYTPIGMQGVVENNEKSSEPKRFNLQEVIEQIKSYTYTEEDTKQVDNELLSQLKNQFDLREEDIYELHKRGFNLESLLIDDSKAYRGLENSHMSKEESEDTKKQESESKKVSDKISVIQQANDSMYLNTLISKEPITINNLYTNNFKGNLKKVSTNFSKSDIASVLQMNGLPNNEGNTWAAKALMSCGMDVSKQDVLKLQNMKAAVAALEPQAEASGDRELLQDNAVQYEPYQIDRITDDLGMVTDEHIEKLIEEGKDVNITNLRESIYKNTEAILKEQQAARPSAVEVQNVKSAEADSVLSDGTMQNQEVINMDQAVNEIKDQINQIRAKLTLEAAQKISEKLPLESAELNVVAKELQQLQEQKVIAALNQVGLEVNEANITATTEVLDTVIDMKRYPMETIHIELNSQETAVLAEVKSALNAYSENETPVEKRFGETIKKVEGQIESLLEGQNIEVTAETIQAAKALITNGMEVSSENITSVLSIVTKLTTFLEDMTPIQAAAFIKEGMNPYYASVDTLLTWMSKEKLEGLKVSTAETIVALQEQKQINSEQKEAMIGLYRILQGVTKHKEEVIGYLFKNDLPLTIEKLQEATRYIQDKNHIEVNIDDDFGELENLQYNKQSAKNLINEQSEQTSKAAQLIKQLEEMELPVSESNINKLSKMSALLYPYIKEQFKKEVGSFEGLSTLPKSFLDKLEAVQNVEPEVIEKMIEQKVPLTLSNIYWMDKITHEPTVYGDLLNEAGMLKDELPEHLDEIEDELLKLEETAKKEQEVATLSGDLLKYKQYKQLEEASHLQRQLIDKEGLYQIPFVINGERRLVNLYVHKDAHHSVESGQHTKAIISYQTKNLGMVKAYIEIKDDHLGYKVEGETESVTNKLEAHGETLMNLLTQIGYNVEYTAYATEVEPDKMSAIPLKRGDSNFEEMI